MSDSYVGVGPQVGPTPSPEFSGVPTAPTAPRGTSTTQIATTEFVTQALTQDQLTQLLGGLVIKVAGKTGDVSADSLADAMRAIYHANALLF